MNEYAEHSKKAKYFGEEELKSKQQIELFEESAHSSERGTKRLGYRGNSILDD